MRAAQAIAVRANGACAPDVDEPRRVLPENYDLRREPRAETRLHAY
jgi:hypothetical protein